MVELWVIFVMLCLLIATGSALVALRLQYRLLDKTRQEREAWQQAQEGRQRTWEVRQGKHILDAEKKLADQLKDARREWRAWNMEAEQNHQAWLERADIEKELARLPHVEQLELPLKSGNNRHLPPAGWRPPLLYQADLRGHDLAYRYMEHADLREARLAGANLYMADLTGAILAGANLENANLTGANLSGADLRGANLAGASFLVTDLHNALLHGAILLGARHLATRQLQAALYDNTTVVDSSLDVTLPRLPGIQVTPADLPDIPQNVQESEAGSATPSTRAQPAEEETTGKNEASASPQDSEPPAAPDSQTISSQEPVVPAEEEEQIAQEEHTPGQPVPDMPAETGGQSAQAESGKIIQLSVHAARTARPSGTGKRTGTAKGGGRKGKGSPGRSRKSSG